MAKQKIEYKASLGSSSLILIFIVLCLVSFGMLSLSAAENDWNLAKRNADAVSGYYAADSQAESFYQTALMAVKEAVLTTSDAEEQKKLVRDALGIYYGEDDTAAMTVPMERGQALSVKLAFDYSGEGNAEVLSWKVIMTEDYEIDTSMPVWTGGGVNK